MQARFSFRSAFAHLEVLKKKHQIAVQAYLAYVRSLPSSNLAKRCVGKRSLCAEALQSLSDSHSVQKNPDRSQAVFKKPVEGGPNVFARKQLRGGGNLTNKIAIMPMPRFGCRRKRVWVRVRPGVHIKIGFVIVIVAGRKPDTDAQSCFGVAIA